MATKRKKRARRQRRPREQPGAAETVSAPEAGGEAALAAPERVGLRAMAREAARRAREEIDAANDGPVRRPRDGMVRPAPLWGSFPLSELTIVAGVAIGAIGIARGGGPALLAGIAICVLAVAEIAIREHASGYRSHSMLLALLAVAAFQAAMYAVTGGDWVGVRAGVGGVIVFLVVTLLLRRAFQRPPAQA